MRADLRHLWVLLLIAWPMPVAAQATRDPDTYFFQQTFGDFQEELATARDEGRKGLLIVFEMAECPWCKKMKSSVLNQVTVQDYYRYHFRIFTLDVEGDTEVTGFSGQVVAAKDFALNHHRVRATPVFAFFDLDGNLMMKYTGATRDVDEFMWLGEFVVDGHYKTQKFTNYKRARRVQARNQS